MGECRTVCSPFGTAAGPAPGKHDDITSITLHKLIAQRNTVVLRKPDLHTFTIWEQHLGF